MWHGDLKDFIMMHQHFIEARNHFPSIKQGTLTEPLTFSGAFGDFGK